MEHMALKMFNAAAFALISLIGQVDAGSSYVAKLCRGHTCTDPRFPILDYVLNEQKCTCRAHPCWEDFGTTHYCSSRANPYLMFSYNSDRTLNCACHEQPFYNSRHILHDLCPGHNCETPEHPVLDWDEAQGKCICRAHPCWDIDGFKHSCPADKILRYREDAPETKGGKPKGVCECIPKMDPPHMNSDL